MHTRVYKWDVGRPQKDSLPLHLLDFGMRCLFSLDVSFSYYYYFFQLFSPAFHIGVFFFLREQQQHRPVHLALLYSEKNPASSLLLLCTREGLRYAPFAFYYDGYSCMKLDALESLVRFGFPTFPSSSSRFLFRFFVPYSPSVILYSCPPPSLSIFPAQHITVLL